MPEYTTHELIVIATLVSLALAWLKLMRQKGAPRLIAACGLMAYFLPIAGALAALVILNKYDRHGRAERSPQRLMEKPSYTLARKGA